MQRPINLLSFFEAINSKNIDLINSMKRLMNNSEDNDINRFLKKEELQALGKLCEMMMLNNCEIKKYDNYFIGYKPMNKVSKEFDMLRFSENQVLNIELKSSLPRYGKEAIKNQLIKNKFYLSVLKKEVLSCTYVADTNSFYLLTQDEEQLKKIDVEQLTDLIAEDSLMHNELEFYTMKDFIISPYSSSLEFLNHQYFLNDSQESKKAEILASSAKNIGLLGGPGTGKSLLIFDLAVEYKNRGEKVAIIFTGILSQEEISNIPVELEIDIFAIKDISPDLLLNYDVILVDESQRLYEDQFNLLKDTVKKTIFSVDHSQVLHPREDKCNIENKLISDASVKIVKLKEKIRSDKEMGDFIKLLFNLSARNVNPHDFRQISLSYFNKISTAENFVEEKQNKEGWTVIEFTPYTTTSTNVIKKKKIYDLSKSTHQVIGREFDKVILMLDNKFYRNKNNKLDYNSLAEYYPYLELNSLFENITRAKNQLMIVIVNNPNLYIDIQKNILSWKNNILASQKNDKIYHKKTYKTWDEAFESFNKIKDEYDLYKLEYLDKKDIVKGYYIKK